MTEDEYFAHHVEEKSRMYFWLASGVRLEGVIKVANWNSLLIESLEDRTAGGLMCIFKGQLATTMPMSARFMGRQGINKSRGGSAGAATHG